MTINICEEPEGEIQNNFILYIIVGLDWEKNLIYLNLYNKKKTIIQFNSIKHMLNLNNCISLEYLIISGFYMDKNSPIKLKNLIKLQVINSKYLQLEPESCKNLKELNFFNGFFIFKWIEFFLFFYF